MTAIKAWLISITLLLSSCAQLNAKSEFPLGSLQIADMTIVVQVAATPELRAKGLMFQQSAEPGMLLVYREPQFISLWMRNTSMPLDVAFIDANWQINNIKTLVPFDETPVPSEVAAIAALEMPQGWFATNNIAIGSDIALLGKTQP